MSIEISETTCIGCGRCVEICPGSLIKRGEQGKAFIQYPKNCWGCASCLKECPVSAIQLYLGEDMGGKGGKLSVHKDGTWLHWRVQKPDRTVQTITVNRQEANHY